MNVNEIISEELRAAEERIRVRVAALLLGSDAPITVSPSAYPPEFSPAMTPAGTAMNMSHRGEVQRQTVKDVGAIVAFVGANPGSYGVDIIKCLGLTRASDRRYVNAFKHIDKNALIIGKGAHSSRVYYVNPKSRSPAPMALGRNRNAANVGDAQARDNKLVRYVKDHPHITTPGLRDHFADRPGMGSGNAITSAIHRLVAKKRITKHLTDKIGPRGPIIELKAK